MSSPKDHSKDDDYDDIPLQRKRPFGSGLHKKAIAFVPASDTGGQLKSVSDTPTAKPQHNIADIYLSMVLSEDAKMKPTTPPPVKTKSSSSSSSSPVSRDGGPSQICPLCSLPLTSSESVPHEQSFAHQVCLPHSHPPWALDRRRMGLSYLATHGWDPDARKGLGAEQQGIQFPVKAKVKDDNLGVGMHIPKGLSPPKKKEQLLDARKVRKMAMEEKRRAARVREELFGDGRLEKYLGSGK
ncbi:Protein pxr1 [Madurella mycetomatis]|uniref:Protein pxr1 n=1 Tax=Madurella mycetomatis TaxID=100816 RepID=A0A175W6H7_9PEZI|nr:Protein pxr1 [Madurella mycetomatis]KXX79152.1 Protein pxr1 [Madurella mycetomatis]